MTNRKGVSLGDAVQAMLQGMIDDGEIPEGSKIDWNTEPTDLPPTRWGHTRIKIAFIKPNGDRDFFELEMKLPKESMQ